MHTGSGQEAKSFTCPACGLDLRSMQGREGLMLDYDVARWQQCCTSAKLGTPCVCPAFRPQLWQMMVGANRAARAR